MMPHFAPPLLRPKTGNNGLPAGSVPFQSVWLNSPRFWKSTSRLAAPIPYSSQVSKS